MNKLLIAIVVTSGMMVAQTAVVPLTVANSCPAPLIGVFSLQTKIGATTATIKLSCIKLDPSVTIDTSTTPPTIVSIPPAQPPVAQCGYVPIYIDAPTALVWPLDTSQPADGVKVSFTLADKNTPVPGTIRLWRNDTPLRSGVDFSLTGAVLVFMVAPQVSDRIEGYYILPRAVYAQ